MAEQHPLPEPPVQEEESASSEPVFTSPPAVYVEPETPDPFLVDDESDEVSSNEEETAGSVSPAPRDIPLSPTPSHPPMSPLPNINKDVPPPPPSDSESEEEEIPDIYVPTLIAATMFLPIPNVRRPFSSNILTWWLQRNLMYTTCTRPIR